MRGFSSGTEHSRTDRRVQPHKLDRNISGAFPTIGFDSGPKQQAFVSETLTKVPFDISWQGSEDGLRVEPGLKEAC